MRTASQRDVMFLDIVVRNEPAHVPTRALRFLIGRIVALQGLRPNGTIRWNARRDRKVFIRDINNIGENRICLLLYDTDANAPGASFANLDTDVQRDEDKGEREGRPESAHLLIELSPEREDQAHRYLALLEESPRLNRTNVQNYLNGLLKIVARTYRTDFEVPHIDGAGRGGEPRMQAFQPRFSLQGHISAEFEADLEAGKLRGITLETARPDAIAFGEGRTVRVVRHDLKLKPVNSWRQDPRNKLRDAIGLGRQHHYETARVIFEAEDGISHTAMIDTETEGLSNDGYIKKSRIQDFDHLLPEASTAIDAQLRNKMNFLL